MAYGELYRTKFFDVDDNCFFLQILKKNYTDAASSNLILAKNPIEITFQQDNDFFKPIIGSSCRLKFLIDETTGGNAWNNEDTQWNVADFLWNASGSTDFLEPVDDREFKVQIWYEVANGTTTGVNADGNLLQDTSNNFTDIKKGDLVISGTGNNNALVTSTQLSGATVLTVDTNSFFTSVSTEYKIFRKYWVGFILQDNYNLPIQDFPFTIDLYASDLIGTLDGYDYELTTARPSAFEAIRECLRKINLQDGIGTTGNSLDFSYKFLCRIFPQFSNATSAAKGNPFATTFINNVQAFQDENQNNLDCKFILASLISMFNCRIFQHEGTWTIISNDALALSSFDDSGGTYNKEFITYAKDGTNESLFSITNPVTLVDSTQNASTLQPMNKDLRQRIKRPAIRHKVNIRIDETLLDKITNGDFETTTAPTGSIPADAYNVNGSSWTIPDTTNVFAVDVNTATFGIQTYQGDKCLLIKGNDAGSSGQTLVATNETASISNTFAKSKLSFAIQAVLTSGEIPIQHNTHFRLSIGTSPTYYYNFNSNSWQVSSTQGVAQMSIAEKWVKFEFDIEPPPVTGTLKIEIYRPDEVDNTTLRTYLDEFIFTAKTDAKYYSTLTSIQNNTFANNNGVIKPIDVRFGQIEDTSYSNTLTDSSGNVAVVFQHFDYNFAEDLETLISRLRLNDMAVNNNLYEGTFRKNKESNNFLTPVDMLTFIRFNFSTFSENTDQQAIDNLQYQVSENRFKLKTHTPNQSSITAENDINSRRGFFKDRPQDSTDPFIEYAYFRSTNYG